jgi:hypothetical protein
MLTTDRAGKSENRMIATQRRNKAQSQLSSYGQKNFVMSPVISDYIANK